MERIGILESAKSNRGKLALLTGLVLLASGCVDGQTDPPTSEEINAEGEFFILEGVVAANGEPVRCFKYGTETEGTNDSKSWFDIECDFAGTATFEEEVATPLG